MSSVLLSACSGVPKPSGGGGGGGVGGPYTVGGTVTGLTGTGLILQDNGGDNLSITGNTSFTFATKIAKGLPYNVAVFTSPTGPSQTCTVSNGQGTATANVTTVLITCSTGTVSIGGNVVGLLGTGLTLQDNGTDNLSVAVSGPFTFKTALTIGSTYAVTVSANPINPAQTCTVTNGAGTANANVGNIQITCSTGTLSIGGTVTGLAKTGSGIVLQDNGGDNLTVKANGTFTFPTLVPSGGAYKVTILTQPSGPNQVCTVSNGTGTANANVTNVQVVCPAIFHTIGGTVVGLVGTNSGMVLQNNLGDNLTISSNGTFTFNTAIADGSTYDVSVLVGPNTQPGIGIVRWFYQGTATSAVTSVIIDCGHNDWAWFDGPNTADQKGTATPAPPPANTFDTSSPGGRKYPATWTSADASGNPTLWLFGGYGLTFPSSLTPPATELNDMWEYVGTQNYFGSFQNYWNNVQAPLTLGAPAVRQGAVTWTQPGTGGDLFLFGGEDNFLNFYNDVWRYNIAANTWTQVSGGMNNNGVYGTQGVATVGNIPGSRWGATSKMDASGTVWLFGGYGFDSSSPTPGLLNDLWSYNITTGLWTWVSGSKTANQTGIYGTLGTPAAANVPGARWSSGAWTDKSGNFWIFGGEGYDSVGNGSLSDVWQYKGGQWTWVKGPASVSQGGIYGLTPGPIIYPYVGNGPGSRFAPGYWYVVDPSSSEAFFWMFGGEGFDTAGTNGNGLLSDLWRYLPYP